MKNALLIIFMVAMTSCGHKKTQSAFSAESVKNEKVRLIQVVSNEAKLTDIFGDTLVSSQNQYYLLTQNNGLVPTYFKGIATDRKSWSSYLESLDAFGNLSFDTATFTDLNKGNIPIRIFNLKNLHPLRMEVQ